MSEYRKPIVIGSDHAGYALKEKVKGFASEKGIEVDVIEGEGLGEYVHTNGKVGTVVNLSSPDAEKARDVAMQIDVEFMNGDVVQGGIFFGGHALARS